MMLTRHATCTSCSAALEHVLSISSSHRYARDALCSWCMCDTRCSYGARRSIAMMLTRHATCTSCSAALEHVLSISSSHIDMHVRCAVQLVCDEVLR
jgi:hypothetical protein